MSPGNSPNLLAGAQTRRGGRRLNLMPLWGACAIGALVVSAIGYTYQQRLNQGSAGGAEDTQRPEAATSAPVLNNAPQAGLIAPAEPARPAAPVAAVPAAYQPVYVNGNAGSPPEDPLLEAQRRAWEQYEQERLRVEAQRREALRAALDAPTTVGTGRQQQTVAQGPIPGLMSPLGQTPGMGGSLGNNTDLDPNKQQAKRDFLNQPQPAQSHYLPNTREAQLSPYEVKAGTVIPSVMISGINSDLPGQIIAQVSENVYDTATGQYLLIPQGSRLVGTYDNGVSLGQERVLVAWNRVIYPDGSSLDLGVMPGADQGGYGGFSDKVNNHYFRVFGNALLVSLFAAGIQLSQPQATVGDNYNSTQIIAGSIGQQMGELGSEIARRGLNIAPTLQIRPGFKFNVMVTKDVILMPWQG